MRVDKKKLRNIVMRELSKRIDRAIIYEHNGVYKVPDAGDHANIVLLLAEMGYKTHSQERKFNYNTNRGKLLNKPWSSEPLVFLYQNIHGTRIWLELSKELATKMLVLEHLPDLREQ